MREPAVCLISWPVGIGEGATLKIATFNINNVNRRLSNLLGWLKTAKPDIVCLQELKAEQSAFPLPRSKRRATAPCGADRKLGTASPSSQKDRSPR